MLGETRIQELHRRKQRQLRIEGRRRQRRRPFLLRALRFLLLKTLAYRPPSKPTRRPGRLKIKTARNAVDVEQFACEMQTGTNAALHCLEVHLAQPNAATRDELVFVEALA